MTSEIDRFNIKFIKSENGCWVWKTKSKSGYGQFRSNGKCIGAHRFSYQIHKGDIPKGMVIDHLCRNPSCVNPLHLECVTMKENTERGILYQTISANAKLKTKCKRGHNLFGANLKIDSRGDRMCKACQIIKGNEWRANNRERVRIMQQIRRAKAKSIIAITPPSHESVDKVS